MGAEIRCGAEPLRCEAMQWGDAPTGGHTRALSAPNNHLFIRPVQRCPRLGSTMTPALLSNVDKQPRGKRTLRNYRASVASESLGDLPITRGGETENAGDVAGQVCRCAPPT